MFCAKFFSFSFCHGNVGWQIGRRMGGAAGSQAAGLKVCHGGGGRDGVAADLR